MEDKNIQTNSIIDLTLLNDLQNRIVKHTQGAVLVSAGAGSGKTRVLTHRIAHLVADLGVKPWKILAITFTNKATAEMKQRLFDMFDKMGSQTDAKPENLWISTFHSLCIKILKYGNWVEEIGFSKQFTVYGEDEKKRAIQGIAKDFGLESTGAKKDGEKFLKKAMGLIGDAKNRDIAPKDFLQEYGYHQDADNIARVYQEYQSRLAKSNAFDFDDLLLKCKELLQKSEQAREYFCDKFEYIHIDEFQDTNGVQYDIVKMLAQKHKNIFAVGDEDQSIYGWRGANIQNLQHFVKDFGATIYKLEQNYRSTQSILDTANKIIKHNVGRIEKTLWSEAGQGEPVRYQSAFDESKEAEFVAQKIASLHRQGTPYNQMAVLMRMNALTIHFERALLGYNIPYKIYGGFKFFERKEVKDILAYLKLLNNPNDIEQIFRIANFPKRGIGDASLAQLQNYVLVSDRGICDVLQTIETNMDLPSGLVKRLLPLSKDIKKLFLLDTKNLGTLTKQMIELLDIKGCFEDGSEDSQSRLDNIQQLVDLIAKRVEDDNELSLSDFLDSVALYSDSDDDEQKGDSVTLATMHSAKGLEWDVVFVIALEEKIFPSARSIDTPSQVQEERRLAYVAVTRARKLLYLTAAQSRFLFGQTQYCMPSRFLKEGEFILQRQYSDGQSYEMQNTGASLQYKRVARSEFSGKNESVVKKQNSVVARSESKTKDLSGFVVGAKVMHKKFGVGTIKQLDGVGGNVYAQVDFDIAGSLQLALAYAPLELC
ncbi:MAG: UvrD-helicase domain-containing protein [Firmicutes bacterium]|nr:UvrD-helicase domain-containing protein [Bacillota bacterium]